MLPGTRALLVAACCSCSTEPAGSSEPDATGAADPAPLVRVGNPSNTGMDTIPDWNALAAALREQVAPRMPDPLPTDPKRACAEMLDAARELYEATEINPEHRRERVVELRGTHADDLATCVEQTSIAAATCTTILLSDKDSEFPWLLDQCMRAYPKP
jgi:hypothetical protein